jgi:hypothetical protein
MKQEVQQVPQFEEKLKIEKIEHDHILKDIFIILSVNIPQEIRKWRR